MAVQILLLIGFFAMVIGIKFAGAWFLIGGFALILFSCALPAIRFFLPHR